VSIHNTRGRDPTQRAEVMRMPAAGGPSQVIFEARPGSWLLSPRSPDVPGVLLEPVEGRTMVVSAFDPVRGRGRELLRWERDPVNDGWCIDMAPDSTRFALFRTPQAPIQVLSLRGEAPREIRLKDFHNLQTVQWTVDGKGLYVSNGIQGGVELLYVDLEGHARVIWTDHGGFTSTIALASPDGHHIALMGGFL